MTREELQRFFDYADDRVDQAVRLGRKGALAAYRDATVFKVMYGWGLRCTETSKLDVTDWYRNPEAPELGKFGKLEVRWGKASHGSPPKRRTVCTVMPWAVEAVEDYVVNVRPRCGFPGHPALWLTERGGRLRPRQIEERFAAYRQALKLPPELVPHCLRHSHVTHQIEDGVDPVFVQLLLSPRAGVHDVQHEPGGCGSLRAGGGYLRSSITQIPRRSDACAAGADARLVA